jgi:hypothetical protein
LFTYVNLISKHCVKTMNILAATLPLPILVATIPTVLDYVKQTWQVLTNPAGNLLFGIVPRAKDLLNFNQ